MEEFLERLVLNATQEVSVYLYNSLGLILSLFSITGSTRAVNYGSALKSIRLLFRLYTVC